MEVDGVRISHASAGRIRFKIDRLKGNPTLAGEVRERLLGAPGVRRVETSPTTGSLLVLYETGTAETEEHETETALARRLASLSGLEPKDIAHRLSASPHAGHVGSGLRPHHVKEFFASLNVQVQSATGGAGLNVLVPFVLVLLGVRGFFAAERAPGPRWYDLLWFGFATFLMLNSAGVPAERAAEEAAEVAAGL